MCLEPTEEQIVKLRADGSDAIYALSTLRTKYDLEPNDNENVDNATLKLVYTLFGKSSYDEKTNIVFETQMMLLDLITKYIAEPYLKSKRITSTTPIIF